jgi:hypothetical protein
MLLNVSLDNTTINFYCILWEAAAASGSPFKTSLIFFLNSFFAVASDPAMMQCECLGDVPEIAPLASSRDF